jgi:hypothetical protein
MSHGRAAAGLVADRSVKELGVELLARYSELLLELEKLSTSP